jgi:hypothetical protein
MRRGSTLPRPGAHLSVTFGTLVPPAVVRGALGTVMRDEVVPGAAEEQKRKDRELHCTHGCRTACRRDAWAAGVWGSARWAGVGPAAAITTTTEATSEEDMKRSPWLAGLIRTVEVWKLYYITFHLGAYRG